MKMNEVTVLRDDVEWSTRLDGEISGVEINGKRINDVHDLTQKVISMTKTIRVLAYTALTLCVIAVGMAVFTTHWLLSHEAGIERLLLTSKKDFDARMHHAELWRSHQRHRAYVHLKEFHGMHWDAKRMDWVNDAMVKHNRAKRGG
jgi:hypothetical protein